MHVMQACNRYMLDTRARIPTYVDKVPTVRTGIRTTWTYVDVNAYVRAHAVHKYKCARDILDYIRTRTFVHTARSVQPAVYAVHARSYVNAFYAIRRYVRT
jgi:hypothetical protein